MSSTIPTDNLEERNEREGIGQEMAVLSESNSVQDIEIPERVSERSSGRFRERERSDRGDRGDRGDGGDRDGARSRERRGRRLRRKVCAFCVDKISYIDYKNHARLGDFISDRGKILKSRMTGTCTKHQRALAVAIKRARHIALLPFVNE